MSDRPTSRKFVEADHHKAFLLWKDEGMTLTEIADLDEMPSQNTLSEWKRGKTNCDCPWHEWEELDHDIKEKALANKEKDLPELVKREEERLDFLFTMEDKVIDEIESGRLTPPDTWKDGFKLLKDIYEEVRLTKGQATEITEQRGGQRELNLTKVAKQLNVGGEEITEEDLIKAAEDVVVTGDLDDD